MNPIKLASAILAAVVVLLSTFVRAQDSAVDPFIVGGKPVTNLSEVPWQVALVDGRNDASRSQFCGGSLVAPQWVLTAAHCVDNALVQLDKTRVDVVGGTLAYKSGGERFEVTEIVVHPKWRQTNTQYDYDAALLKLGTPAKLAKPIALMPAGGSLPDGIVVRVSGWGAISEGGPGSEALLFAEVPVVGNATCNAPESYDDRVSSQMFCAGLRDGGLDSCQGDSGGPVDTRVGASDQLAGVVSWGFGCARRLKYGVYTRVSTISDWASKTIAAKP